MGDSLFGELLDATLREHGVLTAWLMVAVVYLEGMVHWQCAQRLKDKNREIKRLSEERNDLQNLVLGKRLSTEVETKNDRS